jgi:hypothetical protein
MPVGLQKQLLRYSPNWQFEATLLLGRATGRRNSSIRQLRWSDVDLAQEFVVWRAETDKVGREQRVPLSPDAVSILKNLQSQAIGKMPVFPSDSDPSESTSRDTFQVWLRRAKARVIRAAPESERPALKARLRGVGFHSQKRSFVRDPEFRNKPPKVQEAFVGTNYETLRKVCDEVTPEALRAEMGFGTVPRNTSNCEQAR